MSHRRISSRKQGKNDAVEKYKKALSRQKQKLLSTRNTPNSKMKRDVAGNNVSHKIRRTLVFHNALMSEMKATFAGARRVKQKRTLCQVITSQVLRKYRVLRMVQNVGCDPRILTRNIKAEAQRESGKKTRKWNAVSWDLVTKVHSFYTCGL